MIFLPEGDGFGERKAHNLRLFCLSFSRKWIICHVLGAFGQGRKLSASSPWTPAESGTSATLPRYGLPLDGNVSGFRSHCIDVFGERKHII